MSKPPELDRNQDATCYVGNLDDRATDALVWELMIQAGPIVNVHLPKDRVTQAHQGYGFAEFQTEEDAEYACKIMNGIKLYGKPLRVNKASSDKKQIDIGANLFVGNLDVNADERSLFDAFSNFGPVVGLPNIARDPTTGVSKGYGFVSFDSFEAADAAIESLDNQYLLNRPIHVDYALKKDGKGGERHGTAAERLLAAQARKNNVMPVRAPMGGPPAFGAAGQGWFGAPQGGSIPPPPPPGFGGAPPLMAGMVPPPPPGFATAANGVPAYSGPPPGAPLNGIAPPPPGFEGQAPTYGGPPPPAFPPIQYAGPPPGVTGSNNAPLGPRRG